MIIYLNNMIVGINMKSFEMRRLSLFILIFFTFNSKILAQTTWFASKDLCDIDKIKSTYFMAVYDVDSDCYINKEFRAEVNFTSKKKVTGIRIEVNTGNRYKVVAFLQRDPLHLFPVLSEYNNWITNLKYAKEKFSEWILIAKKNNVMDYSKKLEPINGQILRAGVYLFEGSRLYTQEGPGAVLYDMIFKVSDVGTPLLIIKPRPITDTITNKYGFKTDYINHAYTTELGFKFLSDTEIGRIVFSSPQQIQSLIDVLSVE